MKISNFWRKFASFYQSPEWNEINQYVNSSLFQHFLQLVSTIFLFWRYLNSSMTRFFSDILLPFLNSNDLNSCVTAIAQRAEIIKLNHLYLYDKQTASHLNCLLEVYSDFYFLFLASNEDPNMKAKRGRNFLYFMFLIFYL